MGWDRWALCIPLKPGDPQGSREDPTTHTMPESLLQLWHTQECFAPTTSHPPSHPGAQFPLDLSVRKELRSYRLVWIWARYLKIQGWQGKGRCDTLQTLPANTSEAPLHSRRRLLGERHKMPCCYF